MGKEELEEAIKILREPIVVSSEQYYYFKKEDYDKLKNAYETAQVVIEYIETILKGTDNEADRTR